MCLSFSDRFRCNLLLVAIGWRVCKKAGIMRRTHISNNSVFARRSLNLFSVKIRDNSFQEETDI
ncbi:MAG: hypothetical protein V7K64_23060 [Nostoc sp.]|uniref:hypothetical protein n=1 Tax=unclassified Nostoc TaxID=2593658 RepID=UPI001DB23E84|nr:hypothetical protein [Nostoc sp. JL34]MBN3885853.1 hypothetical protein [Nostoc sp. JL34]